MLMKPNRLSGVLALALALAAPAPALLAQTTPAQADATAANPLEPPVNWWLLDPQSDNVRGIGAERAYRELLAGRQPKRNVVVAIIDSGIEIDHPDLKDVIWTNPRETAGNGRDDDGNGYVDDVHGWDFIGGKDGRDVTQDTYESVRLYRACRARQPLTAECQGYKTALDQDRAEAAEQLEMIRQYGQALQQVTSVLQMHLQTNNLTPAKAQAISTMRQDVMQARDLYLQFAGAGLTREVLDQELKNTQNRLQYSLNPEFDPRGIVGDNYDDPGERGYGNAEVEGPDADHGTHVAGIVGAVRGNGMGIDGVASGVRIMVLRVVPDGDERDKDVANAIRYAADNGAQVINMSFGKAFSPRKDVVDAAVKYADSKGVLMVHASGNGAANLDTEANFPNKYYATGGGAATNWIEVGASSFGAADSLAAPFSNYSATKVDIFAPGVSIQSTIPNGGYTRHEGTSMAAPVVTGAAALIMAHYPELSATQVREILMQSATRYTNQSVVRPGAQQGERVPFGQLSATGGIVNVYEALRLAQQRAGGRN